MQKKSFLRRIAAYMAVLVVLLLCVLSAYMATSYAILYEEVRREAQSLVEVYGGDIKARVARIDDVMVNLLLRNYASLILLKSPSESRRFYASQDIHNYLADLDKLSSGVSGLCVADAEYDICVEAASSRMGYWEREAFRSYAIERAREGADENGWRFTSLNGRRFLCRLSAYQGRAAAAFTSTDELMQVVPNSSDGRQTFALTDGAGLVVDVRGASDSAAIIGEVLANAPSGAFTVEYEVLDGRIKLCCIVHSVAFWTQTRVMTVVVAAVILVTLLFGVLLFRYVRVEMLKPMSRMTEDMRRIDGGEYERRIEGSYNTREFTQLQDTFNRLMDEIMRMKIESYEKLIELRDMELKSIRLQLRPHFFLNAIATLSSLGAQGRSAQIKTYADALSRNIRYMFKSGLHTVSVGEEIQHIENYFDMQECRYPGCIFHYVELPQELEAWEIPQMLVQTFVENEYKYAVSVDSLLTLLIRVSAEEYGGERMLVIRIEDDGKGYPEDVLNYMNGVSPRPQDDGERVGLWSVKRMMALMYERDDLITLSNVEPHGCLNLIRVPMAPKRQLKRADA